MTTNTYLEKQAKIHKFINFRGVIFKDQLNFTPKDIECGILGSKNHTENDMHWTAWFKDHDISYFFGSFGLPPDINLQKYLNTDILYSTFQVQHFGEDTCGYWCLWFLYKLNTIKRQKGKIEQNDYIDVIIGVINNTTF
jgi:hypothetical protein